MNRAAKITFCLIAVVALAAGVAGCGGGSEDDASRDQGTQTGEAMTEGAAEMTGDEVGTREGQFPPEFTLPDLSGASVSLADFKGKVVVLDLWATWCGPCRMEIPFLVSLYEEYKDDGLVVVGVGLDKGGERVLKPFAESNNMSYPVLVGNPSIQAEYGVTGIPTTFILDRNGRISAKHVGFHPSMADGMKSEIVRLLGDEGPEA